jgi:uncharacterized protein (TIGR02646 family)
MIRIRKPSEAPKILGDRGSMLTSELCRKADAGEPLDFDRDTYGATEVKQALCTAQHDKCCFCESKVTHAQFGDVEHFRPKGRAQQSSDAPPTAGYYWLAYTWNNLYLCCEVCNRRHKRGLFPLANPEQRVSSHHRSTDLGAEQPLFIDPGNEDPAAFIEFRREYAAPVHGSARGQATVDALQLNRAALLQRRREHRQPLLAIVALLMRAIRDRVPEDDGAVVRALDVITSAVADNGLYSSMARSLFRHLMPGRDIRALSSDTLLDALRADAAAGRALRSDEL